jgi:hypothetical protein
MRVPFAHRVKGSLLFVLLLNKKQTEVIRLQMDWKDLPIFGIKGADCHGYWVSGVQSYEDTE